VIRELRSRCGLASPRAVTAKDVAEFIDPSLQRNTVDRPAAGSGSGSGSDSGGSSGSGGPACDPSLQWSSFAFKDAVGQPDTAGNPAKVALKLTSEFFCFFETLSFNTAASTAAAACASTTVPELAVAAGCLPSTRVPVFWFDFDFDPNNISF